MLPQFQGAKRSQIYFRLNAVTPQQKAVLFGPQRGHTLFSKRYRPIDLFLIDLLLIFYIYIYIYIYIILAFSVNQFITYGWIFLR
jgi:hypothetical protein